MSDQATPLMPALFVGHGNPMLTLGDNTFTRAWAELGARLPVPKAILVVSAHWYIPKTCVTVMAQPRTIHDFYGFPAELFHVEYPAAGSPELAERVVELLAPHQVTNDQQWGLDHGTWSVLRHVYPQASIPVVQLSLNLEETPQQHYRLARQLGALRREEVLIIGSGNLVHNIARFDWRNPQAAPESWATEFDEWARDQLLTGSAAALVDFEQTGRMASLAVPTPDHYLPLLYLAALIQPQSTISFPVEGFDGGTMSMRAVLVEG